jgi:hypothetical protein
MEHRCHPWLERKTSVPNLNKDTLERMCHALYRRESNRSCRTFQAMRAPEDFVQRRPRQRDLLRLNRAEDCPNFVQVFLVFNSERSENPLGNVFQIL